MAQERLLERISRLETDQDDNKLTDVEREIRSINKHLLRMLNTRQGSTPIAMDYGIADFTNFPGETLSETGEKMEAIIKETLLKYEPRLSDIKITFDSQAGEVLSLRFKLDAILTSDQGVPVAFETVLSSSGKCNITN